MKKDLIAATIGFFGNFTRQGQMWNHGNRERKGKSEKRIGGSAVVAEIVDDDGEKRTGRCGRPRRARTRRRDSRDERNDDADGMREQATKGEVETNKAAGRGFGEIERMAAGNRREGLAKRRDLREVGKSDEDLFDGDVR